ncbi:uncharacterized protein PHACADRAFT_160437 [Phanerochaete carnosa HHB-10118-sp]|uniref:Uncharacterized protein n=1 Tax=Phanerochaete carnosa (strain HHB-10118-sp) TaxID=650164 RepID=K5X298_PHACS|nr:uncharacterized protein PHACADRAFT_160437 [Phanerochaete carnosa HHB-10118-sp]EKM56897.1 hypothetical protein PHACADRAFT_160437 [Phanerochaete carnosa HHB-10118-sp]
MSIGSPATGSLSGFSKNVNPPIAEADFDILLHTNASTSLTPDTTFALRTYGPHTAQAGQNVQLISSGWSLNLPSFDVARHL